MSTAQVLKATVRTQNPGNGIAAADSRKLAEGLSRALSDTYVLYVKTQGFHWNVVGPLFHGLHKLTEEQYTALAEATDELAERIRALGHPAPAGLAVFMKMTRLEEMDGQLSAEQMATALVADHETVSRSFRELVGAAEKAGDVVTADLLTRRIEAHEEAAWMLRSIVAR